MSSPVAKPPRRARWADDVERMLAEAFGDEESAAVPEPAARGTTQPYRFDDFVFARARTSR